MPRDSKQVPGNSPPPLWDIEPCRSPINRRFDVYLQDEHHKINCAPARAGTALEALHFVLLEPNRRPMRAVLWASNPTTANVQAEFLRHLAHGQLSTNVFGVRHNKFCELLRLPH
jgi:hypothetical protein